MRSNFRGSALALLLTASLVSTTVRAAPPMPATPPVPAAPPVPVAPPVPAAPTVPATPPVPKAESSPAIPKSEAPPASPSSEAGLEQSPETLTQARELFWKAHALFEQGEYVEALRLFEQTYALRPEPEVLFNLALTHLRLNHCDQARSLYQEYRVRVEPVSDAANPPKELVLLDEHCGSPAPPAPETTTRVPAPLAITVVKTTPPASNPVPSPAPEPPTPADVADSEPFPFRTLGWVAVGASAVALGAAAYFEVQRRHYHAEYYDAKSGDDADEAEASYLSSRKLAVAMLVTSGVLAAGGITLLVVAPDTPTQGGANPVTELGLGLQFSGSF